MQKLIRWFWRIVDGLAHIHLVVWLAEVWHSWGKWQVLIASSLVGGLASVISFIKNASPTMVVVLGFGCAIVTLLIIIAVQHRPSTKRVTETNVEVFYDPTDPNCQSGGTVYLPVVGDGNVLHDQTLYRLGIKSESALQGCRVILEKSEPEPHDPSRQRLALAMRPLIPTTANSGEFTANPSGAAYVEVLQEVIKQSNLMNEFARIKLTYSNKLGGKSNWFENGDYVLTFRLEGAQIQEPVRCRVAVEFDGRRQHRRWRVKQLL